MENKIQCPKCKSQARIQGMSYSTCLYYPTVYDAQGRIISADGNIHTNEWTCTDCGTRYSTQSRAGKIISTEEITNGDNSIAK